MEDYFVVTCGTYELSVDKCAMFWYWCFVAEIICTVHGNNLRKIIAWK